MWIGYETRLGDAWIEWDETRLVRLGLPGVAPSAGTPSEPPRWVDDLTRALSRYFSRGPLPGLPEGIDLPATTEFRSRVYRQVTAIPAGSTMTYAEVAAAVGRPAAARAVGAAMADNPLAPLIPCHRVVGSDGSLRGYAGGIDMKRQLIDMEGSDA